MKQTISWKESKTLGEVIYELVKSSKLDTPEFKSLEAYYGKKKLREHYKEELKKRELKELRNVK